MVIEFTLPVNNRIEKEGHGIWPLLVYCLGCSLAVGKEAGGIAHNKIPVSEIGRLYREPVVAQPLGKAKVYICTNLVLSVRKGNKVEEHV